MVVKNSKLSNGLRVVSHQMPHLETVSLGVWIGAGSRHEQADEHGIAHFLEHMAFKGTTTRSAYNIVEEIESVGGDLNASTGLDQTSYYALVMRPDVEVALSLLGDILLNPVIEPEEVRRERDVIIQEIMANDESAEDVVFDLAQGLAFPGQSLGRPVMGTIETVTQFKAADLNRYMARHYVASNMVLSAAGAIEHDQLVNWAEKYFSELSSGIQSSDIQKSFEPLFYQGDVKLSELEFDQGHAVLGFEGVSIKDEDIFALQVLNNCLGGGMSSRLFQEVREKRGLCYHVYSFHSAYVDGGLFGIYGAFDPKRRNEVIDVMMNEIVSLAKAGVTLAELKRAKAQLRSGLAMSLESSGVRAEHLARQMLFFDRVIAIEELQAAIEGVKIEDCQRIAQKILNQGKPTVALVGGAPVLDGYGSVGSILAGL